MLFSAITCYAQSEADVNVSEGGYGMVKTNIHVGVDHAWGSVSDGFAARVSYEAYRNGWLTVSANMRSWQ